MINILWDLSKIWRYCSGYMCVRSTRQVKDLHGFNSSPLLRCFGNAILASPNRSVFELKTACSLVHCGTKPTSGCHCKPHYMTYIAVEGTYIYKTKALLNQYILHFLFLRKMSALFSYRPTCSTNTRQSILSRLIIKKGWRIGVGNI